MSIASEITRLQGAKADLATAIEGKGVTVPSATKLDGYADLVDAISQGGGGGTMQSKSVSYTPTTSAQSDTVTPDTGYDGLSSVAVSVAAMPTGTVGTPVAVVGTVTNNSVDVKPVVVTQAGYIATERKEGTAVTVSASDLVSGTKSITSNGNNQDVVGYAAVNVNVPNSYSAGDEGKVVSNGALVAQTSDTVTTNDTYDTTLINSLTVNVPTPVYSGNDFVERYFSTSDFESDKVFNLPDIKFGAAFKARSLRLLNATGGNMYGMQYFLTVSALTNYIVLPGVSDVSVDFVKNVTSILGLDFGTNLSTIRATAFTGATSFDTLVIRKSTGVPTLANINAFNNSCFASGKAGGILYVPNDMIASYQSASNWSTILGYTTNQIKSIESTHTDPNAPIDLTTHYVDGTLIPT